MQEETCFHLLSRRTLKIVCIYQMKSVHHQPARRAAGVEQYVCCSQLQTVPHLGTQIGGHPPVQKQYLSTEHSASSML